MQKNIIYITGTDSYGIELEVKRWIRVFTEKYSDINIDRVRLEERNAFALVRDNLTMTGLFSTKRLFLFSWGIERKIKGSGFEEVLGSLQGTIPEDHFCVFHTLSAKEEWLISWLEKNTDVRRMDTLWNTNAWRNRFPEIREDVLEKILQEYRKSEEEKTPEDRNSQMGHLIASTLELTSLSWWDYQKELLRIEWGGKLFDLVDSILNDKKAESIILLRKILETMNPGELLPSLIGLLRNPLYIKYLQVKWKDSNEIGKIIKVHPFIMKKSLTNRISFPRLQYIFGELVSVNKAYKSGKWLQDSELWRIFWIEIALMGLKK